MGARHPNSRAQRRGPCAAKRAGQALSPRVRNARALAASAVDVLVRFGKTDLFDTDAVHESELGRVIDLLAARPQLFTDENERAAILHVAAHLEAFVMYLRRDPARRAEMISQAKMKSAPQCPHTLRGATSITTKEPIDDDYSNRKCDRRQASASF